MSEPLVPVDLFSPRLLLDFSRTRMKLTASSPLGFAFTFIPLIHSAPSRSRAYCAWNQLVLSTSSRTHHTRHDSFTSARRHRNDTVRRLYSVSPSGHTPYASLRLWPHLSGPTLSHFLSATESFSAAQSLYASLPASSPSLRLSSGLLSPLRVLTALTVSTLTDTARLCLQQSASFQHLSAPFSDAIYLGANNGSQCRQFSTAIARRICSPNTRR